MKFGNGCTSEDLSCYLLHLDEIRRIRHDIYRISMIVWHHDNRTRPPAGGRKTPQRVVKLGEKDDAILSALTQYDVLTAEQLTRLLVVSRQVCKRAIVSSASVRSVSPLPGARARAAGASLTIRR